MAAGTAVETAQSPCPASGADRSHSQQCATFSPDAETYTVGLTLHLFRLEQQQARFRRLVWSLALHLDRDEMPSDERELLTAVLNDDETLPC